MTPFHLNSLYTCSHWLPSPTLQLADENARMQKSTLDSTAHRLVSHLCDKRGVLYSSCFRPCSASSDTDHRGHLTKVSTNLLKAEVQREYSNVLHQYFRHQSTILFFGIFPHPWLPYPCFCFSSLSSIPFRGAASTEPEVWFGFEGREIWCTFLISSSFPIQPYFWVNLSHNLVQAP